MKKITLILALILTGTILQAQTDWSKVDFEKKYNIKTKIPGGIAKSLKSEPTFLNDYKITQASLMKGVSQAGMMQKQGVGNVFGEAALAGVSAEALQKMIDELYAEFVTDLKAIGLNISDGQQVIDDAGSKKDKNNTVIGKTDGKPIYDKTGLLDNTPDIKEQNIFRPNNKNVYVTNARIPGNFYNNAAKKANVNMLTINYTVRFASFESTKKASSNTLTTTAGLSILPTISIINPKAAWGWIEFGKQVEADNGWSLGLVEEDARDGSFWGLSSKGEYSIHADEAKYIAELKGAISSAQKAIVAQIKASL